MFYGVPASMFQYLPETPTKIKPRLGPLGLGWKSTTYDRSSLYLSNTFPKQCAEGLFRSRPRTLCDECDLIVDGIKLNSSQINEPQLDKLTNLGKLQLDCSKIAPANHVLLSHGREMDGHFTDFVVPRYFKTGDCLKNNRVKYTSKEEIYISKFGYNNYQAKSFGSNVHSLTYQEASIADVVTSQYDKSRIVPGFDISGYKIFGDKEDTSDNFRLNFDKISNWSCKYTVMDKVQQLKKLNESGSVYFNPNLWKGNFAFFGDRENLTEKYKLFFNKTGSDCSRQLNVTEFPIDFIESKSQILKLSISMSFIIVSFLSL